MNDPDTKHRATGAEAIDLSGEGRESSVEMKSGMQEIVTEGRDDMGDLLDDSVNDADALQAEIERIEDELSKLRNNPRDNSSRISRRIKNLEELRILHAATANEVK